MKPFVSFIAGAAALALSTAPIAAQERDPQITLGEFFAPERIAMMVANAVISGIRTRMEFRYDHLSADPLRGTVSISGITARPLLPYDQARQCEIRIARATLNSDFAVPFKTSAELNLNLIGAVADLACLEREMAIALRTAGYKELPLDQFKLSATYTYTTGETAIDSTVAVNGFGILDVSAIGTLLPRLGTYGYPGDAAFRINRAVVTLKDDGGWAAVSQVLPPNLRDPVTIRELGTEAVSQFLSEGGMRPLGAVERRFVTNLMAEVESFVADPGEITIEADLPPNGIVIEPEMYQTPQTLVAALGLQARSTPVARSQIISAETLAAYQSPETLSDDARIALATALLDGNGVPRSPALVPDLLTPLLENSVTAGPAAALLARAVRISDVPRAYGYALIASAAEMPGAVGELDLLEAQMRTQDVLAAQAAYLEQTNAPAPITLVSGDDPRALRRLALAHFTGDGAVRSYARAYYFALLAEAAGDIAATSLRGEIEARFDARGQAVAQAWNAVAADVQTSAITDWIAADLPAIYMTAN